MAASDPKTGKKIIDVAGPNAVSPSASSRPLIVGNRAVMAGDPMVVASTAPPVVAAKPDEAMQLPINHQAKMVTPLSGTAVAESKTEDADKALGVEKSTPTEADKSKDSEALSNPVDPAKTSEAETAPDEEEAHTIGVQTDDEVRTADVAASAKESKKVSEADAKRQAELEAIIEKGTYAVPINAVGRKRSRMLAIELSVLVVLLVVGAADILLDMGTVQVSGIQHTHFFKK